MIVPVGLLSFIGLRLTLPYDRPTGQARLDWTGFLSLSVAIACVQLVLSRGQRLDWFDSAEIQIETFIAIVSFWIFLAHSLTAERRRSSTSGSCSIRATTLSGLVLVLIYGMLNFTPMVLLPPLLQAACGVSRRADRRGHRRAWRRRDARLLPRDLRRPHGSAHRPDRGLHRADTVAASG